MPDTIRTPRQQHLVKRIAEARATARLTQAQVAERMGRHQPFIANIERGDRRIDLVELIELAEIINLDLHLLVDELSGLAAKKQPPM